MVQFHVTARQAGPTPMPTERHARGAPSRRLQVLLVGAPHGGRAALIRGLEQGGYEAVCVEDGAEALIRLRATAFAAVLLTHDLPGISGLALLPGLRMAWPEIPVILLLGPGERRTASEALEKGALACLVTPVHSAALLRALDDAAPVRVEAGRPGRAPECDRVIGA